MAFRLIYTERAVKDIRKLDVVAGRRLKKSLEKLASCPLENSTKLINHKLGQYRYRVGDYRVIFDLDDEDIVILRVGHRREIY
ncbi:MAG: type II toxin-antitoxin system RelE/ParE family toxin [Actinomycetota bacterium]|nr:type II toxin-antitoxin system RelE/ParE family toxin [Actinomycetota bacterium]